jgi:hypothetical protein
MAQPSSIDPPLWDQIVGEDLSAVNFIRDYVRFEFNPTPTIDGLSKVTITSPHGSAAQGDSEFANLAIALIGSILTAVVVKEGESFDIRFADESIISISLRPEDYVGPEAVLFRGPNGQFTVI